MYIIDDLKSTFYKKLYPLMNGRGIDLCLLSEIEEPSNPKAVSTFISTVDKSARNVLPKARLMIEDACSVYLQ